MLSAVDTLLEAAKFLEQQEQHQPPPPHLQLQTSRHHRTPPPLHRQSNNVPYGTTIVGPANLGGLLGGSSQTGGIAFINGGNGVTTSNSLTNNGTTTIAVNGSSNGRTGNGFSSPPPAGTTVSLKSKVLLNGHHQPLQNGGSTPATGRLLSPTLVSLPVSTTATLTAVSTQAHLGATVVNATTTRQPLLPAGVRKRTYSNASNGGTTVGGSVPTVPSTTTTVLVGTGGMTGYVKDEPLTNGHSTAPPLVVIATNGTQHHAAKHLTLNHVAVPLVPSTTAAATTTTTIANPTTPPMTIDLSTKGLNHQQMTHYHASTSVVNPSPLGLSTTPPVSTTASSLSSSSSSSSSFSSSSSSSTLTVSPTIDDSQSSLNLSNGSSINGYMTSSSNSSSSSSSTTTAPIGGSSPLPPGLASMLPINISSVLQAGSSTPNGTANAIVTGHPTAVHHLPLELQQQVAAGLSVASINSQNAAGAAALFANIPTGTRRRTTSSNSNGVGTREVHNKLEKNRRAHLKECFEQLKKQLSLQPDEKKISNLSILHAAIRHIQVQKRKEREFEHEMERLAKEKIANQNRILVLKRELTQMGDIDVSRLAPDTDITPNPTNVNGVQQFIPNGIQMERDQSSDSIVGSTVPGRNGIQYSSSSSLSSIATNASITNLPLQTTISPVLSVSSPTRASPALNRSSTSPASSLSASSPSSSLSVSSSAGVSNLMAPLSLTTKGNNGTEPAHNGQHQPASLKITAAPLNGLNLTSTSLAMVNGATLNGTNVTLNGSTATTAPLPVIVGANGTTSIVGITHSQLLAASNGGPSPAIQTIPLNLNVTSSAVSNGLSVNGPTSIAITTASAASGGISSGALQLTSNGIVGSSHSSNASSISSSGSNGAHTTTVVGTVAARTMYNGAHTIVPTSATATTVQHVPTTVGGKELINGTIGKNGTVRTDNSKLEIIATQSQPTNNNNNNNHSTAVVGATAALDPPGTKVITIMNGNTFALAPLDKDSKMGVMYSPILVPTSQGLRMIQQGSNGLATIELAPQNGGNRLQLHLTH